MIHFAFKRILLADLPLLFCWFGQPHIAELWPEPKVWHEFEKKWIEKLETGFKFIASIDDKPIAYVQAYHVNDTDRKNFTDTSIPAHSIGLDLFIGDTAYLNKGYGGRLIEQFINMIKEIEPTCQAIIIDPASDNHRAITCYEKVGFKKLGTYIMPYGTIDGPGPIDLMIYKM